MMLLLCGELLSLVPYKKTVTLLGESFAQRPKKKSKWMHYEWASIVGVGQEGGHRPCIAGTEGLVCQLYCARLA